MSGVEAHGRVRATVRPALARTYPLAVSAATVRTFCRVHVAQLPAMRSPARSPTWPPAGTAPPSKPCASTPVTCRVSWFWLKFREAGRVVLVRPSGCVFSARRGRGVGRAGPGHRHRLSGLPHEPGVDPRRDRPTVSFTKLEPEPGKWHSVCTLFGPSRARGGPAKPRRRRCRGTGPDSAPVADGVRGRRRCRVGPASPGPIVEVIECRRKCAL